MYGRWTYDIYIYTTIDYTIIDSTHICIVCACGARSGSPQLLKDKINIIAPSRPLFGGSIDVCVYISLVPRPLPATLKAGSGLGTRLCVYIYLYLKVSNT